MELRKTTRISRIPLVLGLALGLALHVAPVSATVINFDNLGSLGCTASTPATSGVPNGYEGLDWSSVSGIFGTDVVGLECDAHYMAIYGNSYGAPSPDFAAYNSNGFGEILITPVSGTFDFLGADFSSFAFADAFFDPFSAYSVSLVGYVGGVPTFFAEFDLSSTGYVSFVASTGTFTGLTALGIFSGNDIIANSPFFGTDGQSFLVDNVTVMLNPAAVPEPGTALLLLAGLVALARNPKRRRA